MPINRRCPCNHFLRRGRYLFSSFLHSCWCGFLCFHSYQLSEKICILSAHYSSCDTLREHVVFASALRSTHPAVKLSAMCIIFVNEAHDMNLARSLTLIFESKFCFNSHLQTPHSYPFLHSPCCTPSEDFRENSL